MALQKKKENVQLRIVRAIDERRFVPNMSQLRVDHDLISHLNECPLSTPNDDWKLEKKIVRVQERYFFFNHKNLIKKMNILSIIIFFLNNQI